MKTKNIIKKFEITNGGLKWNLKKLLEKDLQLENLKMI